MEEDLADRWKAWKYRSGQRFLKWKRAEKRRKIGIGWVEEIPVGGVDLNQGVGEYYKAP